MRRRRSDLAITKAKLPPPLSDRCESSVKLMTFVILLASIGSYMTARSKMAVMEGRAVPHRTVDTVTRCRFVRAGSQVTDNFVVRERDRVCALESARCTHLGCTVNRSVDPPHVLTSLAMAASVTTMVPMLPIPLLGCSIASVSL